MNRTILESAKCVQVFKSDRLGVRFYEDGSAALFALAYEIVALDENGDVHFSGVCVNGMAANGQTPDEECCVIAEVIRGDVEELLATCLSEEDEKNDVNVLGFYQDLLDNQRRDPETDKVRVKSEDKGLHAYTIKGEKRSVLYNGRLSNHG